MAAVIVDLADAIATELTAASLATFGVTFTAESSYADWHDELEDMDTLHVDVVPVRHEDSELADRGRTKYGMTVDVGFRKRFGTSSQSSSTGRITKADIDALVLMVEKAHEWFVDNGGRKLSTMPNAVWESTDIRATYIRKILRDKRMYVGVVRVKYEVVKDV